ncbi:KN14E-like protein [Mya arenaria]|uniref:Kinesin-like protein n=1 Tax=Mya arenaria TaxID=6604 RepID=A0ABY7G6N8_MYAAR|nr:KN14E-like protein [Mya arenaria]
MTCMSLCYNSSCPMLVAASLKVSQYMAYTSGLASGLTSNPSSATLFSAQSSPRPSLTAAASTPSDAVDQSAPPTARQTPKQPKRNRQFEEVQIAAGTSSRARSQGASPNPGSSSNRTPRGQDPGASGSTAERRPKEQTSQRGAAANASNGKKRSVARQPLQTVAEGNEPATSNGSAAHGQIAGGLHEPAVSGKPPLARKAPSDSQVGSTVRPSATKQVLDEIEQDLALLRESGLENIGGKPAQAGERVQQADLKIGDDINKGKGKMISSQGQNTSQNVNDDERNAGIDSDLSFDDGGDGGTSQVKVVEGSSSHGDGSRGNNTDRKQKKKENKTKGTEDKAEGVSMKEDDIVFETFYHRSGKEFQCIYQTGMRFYLDDWGSKEWQPFPKRWYNEGLLVTNTILKDDSQQEQAGQSGEQGAGASSQGQSSKSQGRSRGGGADDREGFLMHPTRGRIPTYIFYEIELQKERTTRQEMERNLEEQMTKYSELEVEAKEWEAQLSAATGGRPMSARPISRMHKAGKGPPPKGGKGKPVPMPQVEETVNPDDVLDLDANAKELRKSHTRLKMDVERYMGDLKHIMGQIGPTIKQLKLSEKSSQGEIEEVRALYRKEAIQRKLLYNQLQELRGNIRVFCRVRKDDRAESCLKFPSDTDIVAINPQQGKKMFTFDRVFDPNSTQEQVFDDTKSIITSCADGYNVCLLAYGQTGSGKTFTMMGPENNPGINISMRAMKELFKVCDEKKETMSFNLVVSLVEIYNETIQDLLTSEAKTLELRTAGNKVNIPGLTDSRSHLVLMLAVEGKDKVTGAITRGTLVLCDLAGSERISKTEAEGQRLVEAAAINKSLSALGQVFTALRSSQLHACLFVNVSPDSYNFMESVSTLQFGANARQVALGQAKQNISKGKG